MEILNEYSDILDHARNILEQKDLVYGEIRYTKEVELQVIARDSKIQEIKRSSDHGIGIRVQYQKGAPLTFSSTSDLSKESISAIIDEAISASKVLAQSIKQESHLAFQEPLSEKIMEMAKNSLLETDLTFIKYFALAETATIKEKGVSSASCGLAGISRFKHVITTEGTDISFLVGGTGYKADATIRQKGRFHTYGERKGGTYGFKDLISELERQETASDVGKTVMTMVEGKAVKTGTYDVIVDPIFSGLLAHESFGHMTEADSITTRESALTD
ncbi:MAG: PmbA/TldA family metallopeptidase, partial [Candidatus Odinarchaeota archaeon]